ncbi:uncharacterized protein SETTUDRAFT_168505 [Exserohilum turcica Et28A]|uniref:Uncharacterized protein n=1 Tax=Exserohilum turcicum (strain 28A) TaxID=671987 RepID=R0ITV9_EXST2|nr:uncharacterized protein SETTUDRAFT_168505 [Exserohilum turcica Et28A]EOA88061.1 hypothetical protein SETTUDRAFT_168505 [Exserohilum turcica Et28A]
MAQTFRPPCLTVADQTHNTRFLALVLPERLFTTDTHCYRLARGVPRSTERMTIGPERVNLLIPDVLRPIGPTTFKKAI